MSSKTRASRAKKTGSGRKKSLLAGGIIFLLLATILLMVFMRDPGQKFGALRLRYEYAETREQLSKGLSGRESLPANAGMVFDFEEPGNNCLWMQDMKIPIDMIWLNENKRVITIEENVTPDTYPKTFCPDLPATYAIEVNAGTVGRASVHKGDQLQF
jgi:uncharacterized protein